MQANASGDRKLQSVQSHRTPHVHTNERTASLFSEPVLVGMVPLSWLPFKPSCCRRARVPTVVGIVPEKLFWPITRAVRADSAEMPLTTIAHTTHSRHDVTWTMTSTGHRAITRSSTRGPGL